MKHILMFVENHVRDDPRVIPEAISLTQAGYQVTVIGLGLRPDLPTRDVVQGVNIILAPMTGLTLHPIGAFRGVWRWLRGDIGITSTGIPPKRTRGLSFVVWLLWTLRLALAVRAGAVHSHDVLMLPVGWLYSRLRRVPLVYDSHENAAFIPGTLRRRIFPPLEKRLIGRADAVITVGERLAAALRERGAKRVLVIGNWKRLEDYEVDPSDVQRLRESLGLTHSKLIIAYIGTLHENRELAILLEAVRQTPEVDLIIGGSGSLENLVIETANCTPNIHWLGWVKSSELPRYVHLADVVYCGLRSNDTGQLYYAVANKLFEAFAAGKALIVNRGVGEMGEMLERIPAAILLDGITVDHLRQAFVQLQNPDILKPLQDAAFQARADYNWAVGEARLKQLYAELLGEP